MNSVTVHHSPQFCLYRSFFPQLKKVSSSAPAVPPCSHLYVTFCYLPPVITRAFFLAVTAKKTVLLPDQSPPPPPSHHSLLLFSSSLLYYSSPVIAKLSSLGCIFFIVTFSSYRGVFPCDKGWPRGTFNHCRCISPYSYLK